MKKEDIFQTTQLSFNQLHQNIQLWAVSDDFIDSIVAVAQEFALSSATPLIEVTFGLMLKTIKPEEFKTNLLTSLPPDKQNEAIVSKLVHSSLLPIKRPLAESGIDISIITPLDETFATPYIPPTPETTTEIITSEYLSVPLDEVAILPFITPETLTNSIAPELSAVPQNIDHTSYSAISFQNTPNETNTSDPALISTDMPSASLDIMPVSSVEITPPFNPLPDVPIEPMPTNEQISTNDSLPASAPFVIHQEKPIARATQDSQHKEELLRPLFYSKEAERQEPPSFANLEFKPPENNN